MGTTTGTLTFLFTDIERSTERWQADPDAMASALERHDDTLTRTITTHGGRVFKHTGDGVCAVFDSARQAVTAATAAQTELQLGVRMGLHTGEADERDGDFFGPTLNRCARIMDAGHGGQILVSGVTSTLLTDVDTLDLGEYELKGIRERERIFQLGHHDFPSLRARRWTFRLPTPTTSLVGRERLLSDIVALLGEARVVTLTGVGGVGKTRLALAAAERLVDHVGVVAFVDLATVQDDTEVLGAISRELGLATPTLDALAIALAERDSLILLDNCEHVLLAAADLAEDLAELSTRVRVLATSREGLGVPGEHIVAIPGLTADATGASGSATQLFVERANALDQGFSASADDLATIGEICRRLDGLPLAIELAAARVGVLGLHDLLGRLDERFNLLTGGRRRRSRDRQHTLREAVDWSFELLSADERDAFVGLSVFASSFTLDGAAAVLGTDSDLAALDLVQALVNKSLLTVGEDGGGRRYRYLETIRAYAEERLDERGDTDTVLARLHTYLVGTVANAVENAYAGPAGGDERIRVEIPNLRRCFDAAIDRGDAHSATALIAPLAELMALIDWNVNGWADEILRLPGVVGGPLEADVLAVHTVDMWLNRRFDLLHDLALRLRDLLPQDPERRRAIEFVAASAFRMTGDDEAAVELLQQRIERLAQSDPDRSAAARIYLAWSDATPFGVRTPTLSADRSFDDAIEWALGTDSAMMQGWASTVAAVRAYAIGDLDEALRQANQAVERNVTGSGNWFASLQIRSVAELRLGNLAEAIRTADQDLDHAHRYGDRSAMIIPIIIYSMVLQHFGERETAATLRGFLPRRMTLMFIRELAELDEWLAGQIEPEDRRTLAVLGREMTARQLQVLARQALEPHLDLAPA